MKLSSRIKYYLIGFGLGLILVIFIFGTRGCEWLPNNRVLKSINSTQLYISKKNKCLIECNKSTEKVFHLLENGDVDFSKSVTDKKIKEYFIQHNGLELTVGIDPNDSVSTIINTNSTSKNCECNQIDDEIVPFYMPNKMVLSKLSAKSLTLDSVFQCQSNCLEIDQNITSKLFKEGVVIMEHSYPKKRPNPSFLIKLKKENREFLFLVHEGATKTRIKQVIALKSDQNDEYNIELYNQLINEIYFDENCPCL